MTMELLPGEPAAGPWRAVEAHDLVDHVRKVAGQPPGRPRIVSVDGRGASGKSTLAAHLRQAVARSAVVHTDDLAWHEPFFAWGNLLRDGVLTPLRRGAGVSYQPPAWAARGRVGMIQVPADVELVVVEGVGASQRELEHLVDASIWVQSDFAEAERRGIARDVAEGVNGDREQTVAFWHGWMAHEVRFLAEQRPWERACLVVAGTPTIALDGGQFAVAPGHPPFRSSCS
jgi:pantothenate kinase